MVLITKIETQQTGVCQLEQIITTCKFFWLIDSILHAMYVVVCRMAQLGSRPEWDKYRSYQDGSQTFQLDLAIDLMQYAITLDWMDY